ncbi:MAG: ATP-grasp domain-containing protein [Deltaproteobacteria bacterium]|nr:ATP-grasp domain-containing protein [Deltaproteobacteria bacterium]
MTADTGHGGNLKLDETSILITDVDRRKALPIIRSLGRAGVRVIGLSPVGFPVGGLSRYCAQTLRCPDYKKSPDEFIAFVKQTCESYRPTVFLPLEDTAIELCLAHPECWEPYSRAILPSREVMEISYDKWKTFQLANEVGVPIPASHCPESVEQVRDLVRDWQGGAVIKPRKTSGSRGMLYVDRPDQLEAAWVEVSRDYPRPMIQERVAASGEGLGVFVLIDEHDELVALFGHKRLREYPIAGGPSTLRVSHRDDALVEQSLRLLRAMNFRGVAMVEFKVDPARGEPVLMEVNPRFWGSVALAVASGVDFPLLYHRAAARIPQSPVPELLDESGSDAHGSQLLSLLRTQSLLRHLVAQGSSADARHLDRVAAANHGAVFVVGVVGVVGRLASGMMTSEIIRANARSPASLK